MKQIAFCLGAVMFLGVCGAFVGCSSTTPVEQAQHSSSSPAAVERSQSTSDRTGKTVPTSAADIFPPGPGRDLVLNTCGSCHPVVCTARGQRTADAWASIEGSHKDKLNGLNDSDLAAMFTYLKVNFNDSKPEPKIPAELLQQSCTPF